MKNLIATFTLLTISFTVFAAEKKIQYFSGMIQPSSIDGSKPFGPPYPSISRRIVDIEKRTVSECVFQKGELYITEMTRTLNPLVFDATDNKTFKGILRFNDESLLSWSYDLNVTGQNIGTITGELPDNGATVDESLGTMKIRKIWTGANGQVLISENYKSISKKSYEEATLKLYPETGVPAECQ